MSREDKIDRHDLAAPEYLGKPPLLDQCLRQLKLKTESWQWEQTGNICVEYRSRGEPSGIAGTAADWWVHQLKRDGKTLCWLMFPHERMLELARQAYREGRHREHAGDDGAQSVVLIALRDILK